MTDAYGFISLGRWMVQSLEASSERSLSGSCQLMFLPEPQPGS
jgi:hypothetical protein